MKYLNLSGLSYFFNKIKAYLTSSTYLNSIGISNSEIDDIADNAGYSSGSLPASEDIFITSDIIPNTDNSVDLGASSKNIKMIYTKGITINGTQFLPSNFVNVTTAQTIGGVKTFSDGVVGSVTGNGALSLQSASGTSRIYLRNHNSSNYPSSINLYSKVGNNPEYGVYLHGNTFHPNIDSMMELGKPTSKWKSFNGINPGALSLPSGTVSMDLIGDVSVVGTEKKLSKDITVTGYVFVDVSFSSSNRLNLYNATKKYGIRVPCDSDKICQIMPISAGDKLVFNVLDDGSTINTIKLFACQGNV